MRKLLTALSRTFYRPHSSINNMGAPQGLPDPDRDQAEKEVFTLSDMPPEETAISALTLSCERANDPEWIALFCRVYNLRFAGVVELQPLETN